MIPKSDYNYKTDLEIWREDKQFERQNIARSRPPLHSTPVGKKTPDAKTPTMDSNTIVAKTSDSKTPATESSSRKERSRKEHVPEDPESDPSSSYHR